MITVVVTMAQNCFCWIILNFCPDNAEKYWIQQFECFSQKGKNKTHFFLHFNLKKKMSKYFGVRLILLHCDTASK